MDPPLLPFHFFLEIIVHWHFGMGLVTHPNKPSHKTEVKLSAFPRSNFLSRTCTRSMTSNSDKDMCQKRNLDMTELKLKVSCPTPQRHLGTEVNFHMGMGDAQWKNIPITIPIINKGQYHIGVDSPDR